MKTSFTLYCKDKQLGQGEWLFRSHEHGMEVLDPDDRLVSRFAHEDAESRFSLPSFWRSIKHIVFTTDRGTTLLFDPDSRDVRAVQAYLDSALLAGGIERLSSLRRRAWASLLGGLALLAASLAVVFWLKQGLQLEDQQSTGYARPFFAGVIGGAGLSVWGVYSVNRSARLIRRWRKQTG